MKPRRNIAIQILSVFLICAVSCVPLVNITPAVPSNPDGMSPTPEVPPTVEPPVEPPPVMPPPVEPPPVMPPPVEPPVEPPPVMPPPVEPPPVMPPPVEPPPVMPPTVEPPVIPPPVEPPVDPALPVPNLLPPNRQYLIIGVDVDIDVENTGGDITACTVSSGMLPQGLSAPVVHGGNCRISGNPTTAQSATNIELQARNETGSHSAMLRIVVLANRFSAPRTDMDFDLQASNGSPAGLWANASTMWVVDSEDDRIYAYNRSTNGRDPSQEFTLHADNTEPRGLWSDGTNLWVVNHNDLFLGEYFMYDIATKEYRAMSDIDAISPIGIWAQDDTVWLSIEESGSGRFGIPPTVWGFTISTGYEIVEVDEAFKLILRPAGNTEPQGMWSDGTTLWIADANRDAVGEAKIFAYTLDTRSRDASKDLNSLHERGNFNPRGIWSDGTTMWVSDPSANKVFAYWISDP